MNNTSRSNKGKRRVYVSLCFMTLGSVGWGYFGRWHWSAWVTVIILLLALWFTSIKLTEERKQRYNKKILESEVNNK